MRARTMAIVGMWLLAAGGGCNGPGRRELAAPVQLPAERAASVARAPLEALARARQGNDPSLFFHAAKGAISSGKVFGMTVDELSRYAGPPWMRGWEASRWLFPTGKAAWRFRVGQAVLQVAGWPRDERVLKAQIWWLGNMDAEELARYPDKTWSDVRYGERGPEAQTAGTPNAE